MGGMREGEGATDPSGASSGTKGSPGQGPGRLAAGKLTGSLGTTGTIDPGMAGGATGGSNQSSSSNSLGISGNITAGSSSLNAVSSYGAQSRHFPPGKNQVETVVTPFLPLRSDERVTPSGFLNPKYKFKQSSLNAMKLVARPQPGEDPTARARLAVNNQGFADRGNHISFH